MLSAVSFPKRSIWAGKVSGTHQKLDQIARRELSVFQKKDDFFPSSKDILYFEGRRGPDGLKLKSYGVDEPEHFLLPDEKNPELIEEIKNHYYNLSVALKKKDKTRAAFEAAWLAHFLVDGLTPAHHSPVHELVEEMMGEKEFLEIFGKPIGGIMRGETALETAKNNWRYWGVNGLMSRHIAFEYGIAVLTTTLPYRRFIPKITENDVKNFDLMKEFSVFYEEIRKLDLYSRFARDGWNAKIASDIEKLLLPAIIRMIILSWYSASKGKELCK